MIEFSFARKHVEVKHAERLAGGGIGHEIKLEIVDPFVRHGDLFKLQAEDALINGEHSIEHLLEREVITQRFLIDGVFLFLELVVVVAPIPNVDLRVRVVCVGSFHFLHGGNFRIELRLNARDETVDVGFGARAALRHLDFGLEIVPRLVAEEQRDLVAQREHLIENRNVRVPCQTVVNNVKLPARRFAFGVLFHGDELPGNVCLHGISVVAGLDSRRSEETFGRAVQFSFCENDRRLRVHDVSVEIGA